jgi:hypothetical protein
MLLKQVATPCSLHSLTSSNESPTKHRSTLFPLLSMILAAFSEAKREVKSKRATSFSPRWFFSKGRLPSAPSVE